MRHLQDVRASLGDMQAEYQNAGLFFARPVPSICSLCQADLDSFLKSLTAADEYNAFLQAADSFQIVFCLSKAPESGW